MKVTTDRFESNARAALADEGLALAMGRATTQFISKRAAAVAEYPEFEQLRSVCAAVKAHTLEHLDVYVERFADALEAAGGHVHFASDAAEANAIVVRLAQERSARSVVKGKSMVSEETGLNAALSAAGITPYETDLGEYILQLEDDVPSHIIGPAIHKTREQITALFHERLGTPPDASVEALTAAARAELRKRFLEADMGITGANFLVAESGGVVLVENEGNIRLSTSVPRVHVAVVGFEKLIPRRADLPAFLALLPRSATGQRASSYVSILEGPRREGEPDGPDELHVVLVDNGRSAVLADPKLRDALRCIRCGACLNACPVYRHVGGHAYGWVYSGPIGAILDPGLLGLERTSKLPQASSLCGACGEVCPVKIPIPDLLVEHRKRSVQRGMSLPGERPALAGFGYLTAHPALYEATTAGARWAAQALADDGYLRGAWLPVLGRWLAERDFPAPAKRSFRRMWREELAGETPSRAARTDVGGVGAGAHRGVFSGDDHGS